MFSVSLAMQWGQGECGLLVEKKDLNPKPQMIGVPQNDSRYFSTHTSWLNLDLYNIVYNKTKDFLLSSLHP